MINIIKLLYFKYYQVIIKILLIKFLLILTFILLKFFINNNNRYIYNFINFIYIR